MGCLLTSQHILPVPALLCTQVESDIGPYKGLLMGLFFMTGGWR